MENGKKNQWQKNKVMKNEVKKNKMDKNEVKKSRSSLVHKGRSEAETRTGTDAVCGSENRQRKKKMDRTKRAA